MKSIKMAKKLLALLIAFTLAFTCVPVYAEEAAEITGSEDGSLDSTVNDDGVETTSGSAIGGTAEPKVITGFVILENDEANDIKVETGTPMDEIPFPETITANIGEDEQIEIPVGEWVNVVGPYDPETERRRMTHFVMCTAHWSPKQ